MGLNRRKIPSIQPGEASIPRLEFGLLASPLRSADGDTEANRWDIAEFLAEERIAANLPAREKSLKGR
jgi:hypothetical protein